MSVAIVTGASMGLGRAISTSLCAKGWSLVIDARSEEALLETEQRLHSAAGPSQRIVAVTGDVSDARHRSKLVSAARGVGGLDLVVNNASTLGATPLPHLIAYGLEDLRAALETNTLAPLALIQEAYPLLLESGDPRIVNVTSDASVEAYEGWGGYGASKAALDHLGAVLAAEEPKVRIWTVDPGDMRTRMHQEAFPGEDITDRPTPESVVPRLVALIESRFPSGRYRLGDIAIESGQ